MKIERNIYLNQLISAKHNGMIKIVTGLRRCGKSYLLTTLFHDYLLSEGVDESHIIEIQLDDLDNENLLAPKELLSNIRNRIEDKEQYYVILDEIQMVDRFTDVLNSLLHNRNLDVYVTGSNSHFLSSDIATEFRGRGQVIHLYPLTFAEYITAFKGSQDEAWEEYYTYGGLPLILSMDTDQAKSDYLYNLYNTVYLKDIIERHKIRNREEFEELAEVLASSIGSPVNPLKLSRTFKSEKHKNIQSATISKYIGYLSDAFITEKALRYNIKGKRYIGSASKLYFTDLGIRNSILSFRQQEENHIMENIIYNELIARGFKVDIGQVVERTTDRNGKTIRKSYEVDFVANQGSKRYYIQSALEIPSKEKYEQETNSLNRIPDSFKKIIVVKDRIKLKRDESGVVTMSIFDFLLNQDSLDL